MTGRYQLYMITIENGKDRLVASVRVNSKKKAIEMADDRAAQSQHPFCVSDTKPVKRSGGFIQKNTIIYNTVFKRA